MTGVLTIPPVPPRKPRRTGRRAADAVDIALGARLLALRNSHKITRREVAANLDVTVQQIQKYEEGVDRLSIGRLVRFARLLDTTAASMVAGLEEGQHAGETFREQGRLFAEEQKLRHLFGGLPPELRTPLLEVAESLASTHELVMKYSKKEPTP